MKAQDIPTIVSLQKSYFESGATLPVKARIEWLKKLKTAIIENEKRISDALFCDLGKSATESYMCETGLVISEITYMLRHIRSFAKDKRVATPLAQFPAKSFVRHTPYGTTLIMSPWNYPVLLTLSPLVNALAAGNTAVIKPSAYSPASSEIIKEIIESVFPKEYVAVVTGGREENSRLLSESFDYIFFTGSKNVGITVMESAAKNLTPVTLELGGKSPCIIDKSANIPLAAKRVVFGKYLNCGQTCVAPDYILCHESIKDEFLKNVIKEINLQYGDSPLSNREYGKIVNEKHFRRLLSLIDKEKTVLGGEFDESKLKISPTVLDNVTFDDPVMKEEIFGPIMPIITYSSDDEALKKIKEGDRPLALYIFSSDKKAIRKITTEVRYGGGCINDVVIHLATSNMGFGGVGESGMGAYHGKTGFDTFSHCKSIVDKKTWLDLPMRYHPFKKANEKLIKMFLK